MTRRGNLSQLGDREAWHLQCDRARVMGHPELISKWMPRQASRAAYLASAFLLREALDALSAAGSEAVPGVKAVHP
jgi:hypothetical protein